MGRFTYTAVQDFAGHSPMNWDGEKFRERLDHRHYEDLNDLEADIRLEKTDFCTITITKHDWEDQSGNSDESWEFKNEG